MSESRAHRTLVKSHPELWSELSDPAALARHLGEFGEIRITRLEPETRVVWEADAVSGTVELAASGWGTKVTLTATVQEDPASADSAGGQPTDAAQLGSAGPVAVSPEIAEPLPADTPDPPPGPDPEASGAEPWGEWRVREWPGREEGPVEPWYRRELEALAAAKAGRMQPITTDDPAADEPSAAADGDEDAGDGYVAQDLTRPRRRLLTRFFRRRRPHSDGDPEEWAQEPEAILAEASPRVDVMPQEADPWPMAGEEPSSDQADSALEELEPTPPQTTGPIPVASGLDPIPPAPGPDPQPGPPEPVPPQSSVDAVLTAVLDDLGSAHHRPFSR